MISNRHTIRRRLLALYTLYGKCFSYNELCQLYWQKVDECIKIDDLRIMTPAEAITREYRRMVEEEMVPSMYPERKRRKAEEQYTSAYGKEVRSE